MPPVISIENVSKSYRLGTIGSGTLREDLQSWWHRVRGLPDPNRRIDRAHLPVEGHTLWALQDVSLQVAQGEVLGIIGRNGAGKSTLLKILSRVTAPTSGRIRVKGRVASLLEVGTGFHPELTGRENVFLNGAILGMTKAEVARKFDEIVAFSEIEDFIDTPVKRYSSGMYVRLAFAVAAHLDPEILVVDEVLAVGDAAFQKRCLGKMGDVAKSGRTVLFVSHNMASVLGLCSRAVLVQKGTITCDGKPPDVVALYQASASATPDNPHGRIEAERKGSGLARIVGVVPFSERASGSNAMATGVTGGIRFDYVTKSWPLTVQLAFGLTNSLGEYCLHCSTETLRRSLVLDRERGSIVCRIPRCPLIPDDYNLNFLLRDGGGGALDYIQNAACVRVDPGDFYATGQVPGLGCGSVLIDYAFRTEGAS